MATRRDFISWSVFAFGTFGTHFRFASAEAQSIHTSTRVPDPASFQAGDLIWPRKPDEWIPYDSDFYEEGQDAAKQWQQARDKFVDSIKHKGPLATPQERAAVNNVSDLTYEQFTKLYLQEQNRDDFYKRGSSSAFSVGHVAIITETKRDPVVVEALWGKVNKVHTIQYSEWIKGRADEVVWQGRLIGFNSDQRISFAKEALVYEGRPYDFWNFDLNDPSGFYCSKLAWLSAFRALHVALDGNNEPRRSIWFSPKQLMNSDRVVLINDPVSYTFGH